jgi:stage V sporulation protein G
MEITDIRIRKVEFSDGKLKAVASIVLDNELAVHDIKIIHVENKLFIAMPSRKTPAGEFKDIVHPINQQVRNKIQTAILERYSLMETYSEDSYAEEVTKGDNNG